MCPLVLCTIGRMSTSSLHAEPDQAPPGRASQLMLQRCILSCVACTARRTQEGTLYTLTAATGSAC